MTAKLGGMLFIGHFPPPRNGHSLANERLLRELRRRAYAVCVIDKSSRDDRLKPFGSIRLVIKVAYLARRFRYPVYLTLGSSRAGLTRDALLLLVLPRKRTVAVHVHGGYLDDLVGTLGMRTRALVTFAFRRVDLGLALCDELLDQFSALIPAAKTGVVSNGVDPKPGQRRRLEGGSRADDLRVLFLANTLPSKGLGVVIDAMLLLRPSHPNWCLRVCGLWISELGEDAEAVETNMRSRAQPLGPAVSFDYASTDSEVARALSSSDVLVLPTTYSNEGQPLAIIEALVAGLHVVATDHRCISSMFVDEVDGVLLSVPPSPGAVADALESIAAMSPMSERRRLEHEVRWSVGAMADALLNLIQRPNA